MRAPNPRLQRTRSASPPSPLSRKPLGVAKRHIGWARLSALLLVIVMLGGVHCRQASRWGSPEFNAEFFRLRSTNACEKGIAWVQAADARSDPVWYEWMVDLNLDCLEKTKQPHYGDDALRVVNDGIRRFPKSSRLIFVKGFANARLGERGLAQKYFEDALALARKNMAGDQTRREREEDSRVAKSVEANLGMPAQKP